MPIDFNKVRELNKVTAGSQVFSQQTNGGLNFDKIRKINGLNMPVTTPEPEPTKPSLLETVKAVFSRDIDKQRDLIRRAGVSDEKFQEIVSGLYGPEKPVGTGSAFMGGFASGSSLGAVGYKPEEFATKYPEHKTAYTIGNIAGQLLPFGVAYKGARAAVQGASKLIPALGKRLPSIAATGALAGAPVGVAQSAIAGDDAKTVAKNALLYGALGAAGDVAIEGIAAPIVKRLWQSYKGKKIPVDVAEKAVAKDIGVDWDNLNEKQKAAIRRVVQQMQPEPVQSGRLLDAGQNFTFRDVKPSDYPGSIVKPAGKARIVNKDFEKANEELKEATEYLQNYFRTNELRVNEMEFAKKTLGVDLEKLADKVLEAEQSGLPDFTRAAERGRMARVAGIKLPKLVRGITPKPAISEMPTPISFKKTIELPRIYDKTAFIGQNKTRAQIMAELATTPLSTAADDTVKLAAATVDNAATVRSAPQSTKRVGEEIADIYDDITKNLEGVEIAPDKNIAQIAKEVQGNSMPMRYNMTDIYRNLRNAFGKYYDYVKKNYLDPFDYSKGEYAKAIKKVTDDLYNDVVQKLGIKKGSRESAAVQWYGEGVRLVEAIDPQTGAKRWVESPYTLKELQKDFPETWQKIVEADQWFRKRYDEYVDSVNATLKKIYPYVEKEVEKLRSLQTELRNQKAKVLKDATLPDEAKQSAADLLTEQIREINKKVDDLLTNRRLPKRKDYYRHFREMGNSFRTFENLLGSSAQIDPRLVGVSDTTRPKTRWASFMQHRGQGYYEADAVGGFLDYIKPANYKIYIEPHIPKFRQLAKDLAENTVETKNANNLIEHLQMFANDLAGKTSEFDRPMQKTIFGRKAMGIINWINSRVMANAVLGNARSVISQTANLPMGMSRLKDPIAMQKATGQMLSSILDPNAPIRQAFQKSPFLSERYLESVFDRFDNKLLDQPQKFAVWAIRSVDELATKWMWASAYNKAIKQGISNPIKWADDFARSIVAGRGIGELPLAQKSLLGRLVMPFQVEVANMWHVFGDALKEKDYAGLALMPIMLWIFNEGYKQIHGSDVTFNPIGALQDALNEEEMTPGKLAGRLAGEVLSNLPAGQTLAAALPENWRQEYFGKTDPTRYGTSGATLIKPLMDATSDYTKGDYLGAGLDLASYVLPYGAGQLKKTVEGARALSKGGSYTASGNLRFPFERTTSNIAKSLLFGQYSTPEAREYFDKNRRMLGEDQTKAFEYAKKYGVDPIVMYNIIMEIRALEPMPNKKGVTDAQKIQVINKSNLPQDQKNLLKKLFVKTEQGKKLIERNPLAGK